MLVYAWAIEQEQDSRRWGEARLCPRFLFVSLVRVFLFWLCVVVARSVRTIFRIILVAAVALSRLLQAKPVNLPLFSVSISSCFDASRYA